MKYNNGLKTNTSNTKNQYENGKKKKKVKSVYNLGKQGYKYDIIIKFNCIFQKTILLQYICVCTNYVVEEEKMWIYFTFLIIAQNI